MTTAAIIQARMGSSRFPGKVLEDISGRPVVGWMTRAAAAVRGVDTVVVATSVGPGDDPVADWCAGNGVNCHRGSESDVLRRYYDAAKAEGATFVLRITADCPFLDPEVCSLVLAMLRRSGADYASNIDPRSWPDGLDCEAFTFAALEVAEQEACVGFDREHVTPFIRANEHRFPAERLICPIDNLADERWTLDRPEDLDFLGAVADRLPEPEQPPSWLEILGLLDEEPVLRDINSGAGGNPTVEQSENDTRTFAASDALLDRTERVVPLGSQTFSKSHIQYPKCAPKYLDHGDGGWVWDVDGNAFVDLVSGLLPVVLGYRDPDVDDAVRRQLGRGVSFSLETRLEAELAERLVDIIPCAEMVRFGKNGTDATSAAVRLARAFTGRDRVAVCGYHGWQDWYIGVTTRDKGIPKSVSSLSHVFPFNDISALDELLAKHDRKFAAVVIEPVGFTPPKDGYLEAVKACAHRHGALLVFDEIISGFRVNLDGAQELFSVTPDLACFGKAMANGLPISTVVGRADVMAEMENIFFSGTFGGEALSLAASIATIDKMRRHAVIEHLWSVGRELHAGAQARIEASGLAEHISFGGLDPWRVLSFADHPVASKEALKTILVREMLQHGVLVNASHNVTYAHGPCEVAAVFSAYERALATVCEELERGDVDKRLGNDIIRPVFNVREAGWQDEGTTDGSQGEWT